MSDLARPTPSEAVGLYVHIPFCVRKCPYCDFNTFDVEREAVARFLGDLDREIDLVEAAYGRVRCDTVFIGGGTPTVLSGRQLAGVMARIRAGFDVALDAEVTVEANPGSVTRRGLEAMVSAGVNRVSLGAQSFDDTLLQRLGRNHTAREIYESYALMQEAGLHNVNLDFMFGIPGQSLAMWQQTLQAAASLRPSHISGYSLIIEEGTPFHTQYHKGTLDLPGHDAEADMYHEMARTLSAAGYEHYEISNFALPNRRCQHNEIYWHNGHWIGIGPGAHSYWQGRRYWNVKPLELYNTRLAEGSLPIEGEEVPTRAQQMDETVILALRLAEGVDPSRFAARFGVSLSDEYASAIDGLVAADLLAIDDRGMRLTARGRLLANRVFVEFLRDDPVS